MAAEIKKTINECVRRKDMQKNILLCLIVLILTTACPIAARMGDAQKMGQLRVGMTKAEVLEIMQHTPDRFSGRGNTEYLIYSVRKHEMFIRLIDGKVESYGRYGDFDTTKDPTINLNIKQ
jgi:hypothetical protein